MPSSSSSAIALATNLGSLQDLPLRKLPRQQRSRRRVATMIGAAIDLLILGGTEAVTTSAVSDKAEVPIGSVYQFFPDRETLLLAVAEVSSRPLQDMTQHITQESISDSGTPTPLGPWLSEVITQLEKQWVEHPADVAAWHALVSVPNMDSVTGPIFSSFVNALSSGVTSRLGHNAHSLTPEEINERCWLLTTSLTAVLANSLSTGRTTAMESFRAWAQCMFTS
jgi:AcrR family transcriptional regulator